MSPAKIERDAQITLVAFYRANVIEGMGRLSTGELADRVGHKAPKTIAAEVLEFMAAKRWITGAAEEIDLSDTGRSAAAAILDQRQK